MNDGVLQLVHLVGIDPNVELPPQREKRPEELRVSHRTYVLTAANPYMNIAGVDPARVEMHLDPLDNPVVICASTSQANDAANSASSVVPAFTVTNPAVPATGVAQQNIYSVPVQVVIGANGATITNVSVNGITVGSAAGTYTVPAYGSISIAYSVATPTWAWTGIGIPSTALATANGRVILPSVGEYVIPGPDETWIAAAQYPSRVGVTIVRKIN